MTKYFYTALDKTGSQQTGQCEAESIQAVKLQLETDGLLPLSIKCKQSYFNHSKISLANIALITQQLSSLLQANTPLADALNTLIQQQNKAKIKNILTDIYNQVSEGHALSEALKKYPKCFSQVYIATIQAGEQSGRLPQLLDKLALQLEQQLEQRQTIQQACIYPTLMVIVSFAVVIFLLAYVLPPMLEVFTANQQSLPSLTVGLLTLSNFTQAYGFYILFLLLSLIVLFSYSLRHDSVKFKWHSLLLKIPLITKLQMTYYIHTLASLATAMVPIVDAMQLAAQTVSSLPLKKKLLIAAQKVKEGSNISISLANTKFINPMVQQLIHSGEKSGELGLMLSKAAQLQQQQLQRIINIGLKLLEPIMILVMGSIVLTIVLAVLLPIFQMNQLIG